VRSVFSIHANQFVSAATNSYGSFSSIGGEYLQSLHSLRCRLFYSAEAEENAQGDNIPINYFLMRSKKPLIRETRISTKQNVLLVREHRLKFKVTKYYRLFASIGGE
jgi:hypothetical protein